MREVNQDAPSSAEGTTKDLKEILNYLFEFVKNPTVQISRLPNWNWKTIFLVQISISVLSGFLAGLIKLNFYRVAFAIFLMPIVSTVSALLLATFFYYYFQFFENRTESFRRLLILVILTTIPFYIFQIVSEYFAPISLVGFGFTSLLAIVGLNENFKVERKKTFILVGTLFALVLVTWILNRSTSGF